MLSKEPTVLDTVKKQTIWLKILATDSLPKAQNNVFSVQYLWAWTGRKRHFSNVKICKVKIAKCKEGNQGRTLN